MHTYPSTGTALLRQRRNKGVIDLDLRVVVAEVAVALRSEDVAITKLCVSGEEGSTDCKCPQSTGCDKMSVH